MLANFKSGISSFGIPMFGGLGPLLSLTGFNKVYWVDGKYGSDSVDGSGPGKAAFSTIAQAITVMRARVDWTKTPWARRDICFIAPGVYAENLEALPHGVALIGMGWDNRDAQMGVKIKPASGAAVDVGGVVNTAFVNIGFETATVTASQRIFDCTIINNCLFQNCYFTGPAETATAVGVYANGCCRSKWINCEFACLDIGMDIVYAAADDAFCHCLVEDSRFSQIDTAGIRLSADLVGPSSLINRCNFHGAGQTMGIAVDDNTTSGIIDVSNCCAESTSGYSGCRSVNLSYNEGSIVT